MTVNLQINYINKNMVYPNCKRNADLERKAVDKRRFKVYGVNYKNATE